eukprot:UN19044
MLSKNCQVKHSLCVFFFLLHIYPLQQSISQNLGSDSRFSEHFLTKVPFCSCYCPLTNCWFRMSLQIICSCHSYYTEVLPSHLTELHLEHHWSNSVPEGEMNYIESDDL